MVGIIRRTHGVLGLTGTVFGAAGWADDARTWAGWVSVTPELAGVLVGAGGVMVATWLVWEVVAFRKRDVKAVESQKEIPTINNVNNVNINLDEIVRQLTGKPTQGIVAREDAENAAIHIGTTMGPMTVRLWAEDKTMADIIGWLQRKEMLAPLEGNGNKPPRIEGGG